MPELLSLSLIPEETLLPLPLFHDHWSCIWDLDGLVNQKLYLTFVSALSSPWQSGTTPTLLLTPSQSDNTHDTISYQL